MSKNLIKYKITIWYTGVMIAVVMLLVAGIMGYSKYYIANEAKKELNDEVADFYKEINGLQDISSSVLKLHFYDDGIILSIYDQYQQIIDGYYPDEFPLDTSFEEGGIREIYNSNGYWLVLDKKCTINDKEYWIRGIYTLKLIEGMTNRLFLYMVITVPFLILFAAFIGYRMIQKALKPIYSITKMASDIAHSADLSLRLPKGRAKDELAYLTETFNYMLEHLDNIFQREMQFTSDAAHELRTPISVIISHCEYCLSEYDLGEEEKGELQLISKKAYWMSELVSQLLLIARAEGKQYTPEFEETDLKVLVETVLEELEEKAALRKIRLKLNCQIEEPIIQCDFNLMMRAVMNLIENAIQYGREEGNVEVTIQEKKREILLQVRDDGIGIPEECQKKIWNRFYRVDASHSEKQGFGLGLFMVKWIVELHKGTIDVKSKADIGSIFSISLPSCVTSESFEYKEKRQ